MRYLLLMKVFLGGAADTLKVLLGRAIPAAVGSVRRARRAIRRTRNRLRIRIGLEPLANVCPRCGDLLLPQMEDQDARGGFYCMCINPICGRIVRLPPQSGPPCSGWWR